MSYKIHHESFKRQVHNLIILNIFSLYIFRVYIYKYHRTFSFYKVTDLSICKFPHLSKGIFLQVPATGYIDLLDTTKHQLSATNNLSFSYQTIMHLI